MKQTKVALPPELKKYAEQRAAEGHESLAAFVRRLIVEDQKRSEQVQEVVV